MSLTLQDIKKLETVFSAKFATKEELKEEMAILRNQMLTSEDKIMKRLEDMWIELKVTNAQLRRHNNTLENHEMRITQLEAVPA